MRTSGVVLLILANQTDITIDKSNTYRFAHLLLDIGEGMLCSGAEVHRVEENILKICASYGVEEVNIFVIPSVITLTLRVETDFEITQTRRVMPQSVSVNLRRLEMLNDICHKCRNKRFALDELDTLINESNKSVKFIRFLLGSILAASSFTVFFGGTLKDGLISALIAVVVCLFQRKASTVLTNRIIANFICALIIGLLSGLTSKYVCFFNSDKVIIGNIMLIVPGVAFTVSVRDIILEDTISGSLKLIDSLFLAGGLALGILVSFMLCGG